MDYNAQLVFSVQQEYLFERFSYMANDSINVTYSHRYKDEV